MGRMGRMAKQKAATHPITTSTMAGRISSRLFYRQEEVGEEGRGEQMENQIISLYSQLLFNYEHI